MTVILYLLKHRLFVTALIVFCVFALFALLSLWQPSRTQDAPFVGIPTPIPLIDQRGNIAEKVSPLQQTIIGRSTLSDVERLYGTENKRQLPDNYIEYSIPSSVNLLPNSTIVKGKTVVFEKIVTPKEETAEGFSRMSRYSQTLGEPEATVQGSDVYGPHIQTLVYAKKGIAVVGNPNTDIVYEIHRFVPTTVALYTSLYGRNFGNTHDHTEKLVQ